MDLPKTKKFLDDDEFFHITCHVDASVRSKIEKGEYVDLESCYLEINLMPEVKGD